MNKINIQFEECLAAVSSEINKRVEYSFDIADRIFELLEKKGISQKELAQIMGKKESQVSRWIQGSHNFTLETLAAISTALGEDIIKIPCKRNTANKFQQMSDVITYHIGGTYNDINKRTITNIDSIAAQQHSKTTNYRSAPTKVIAFKFGQLTNSKSLCN